MHHSQMQGADHDEMKGMSMHGGSAPPERTDYSDVEVNIYDKNDPAREIGSGLSDGDIGLD